MGLGVALRSLMVNSCARAVKTGWPNRKLMHREGPRGEVQSFLRCPQKTSHGLSCVYKKMMVNKYTKKKREEKLTLPYKKGPPHPALVCVLFLITSPRCVCLCRSRVGDFYLCVSPPQGVISHPARRHFSFLYTKVTLLRDDFQ